ncbi:t-SNARE [Clavulina sp. PMI_390]|nr:t-SNARE [Clavulina sp. PMI_390]
MAPMAQPLPAGMDPNMAEIESISQQISLYSRYTAQIGTLHARSLEATNDEAIKQNDIQLAELQNQVTDLQSDIRRRIQVLGKEAQQGRLRGAGVMHANRVRENFRAAIQDFQNSERDFRARYAQRVERQFRIVKADATPEEIRAVTSDPDAGNQIFRNAVAQSGRYGEARLAFKEAQDRNAEIKRLEASISQLAALFNDMAVLIEEQEEVIDHVHDQAQVAHVDLEKGGENMERAVDSARAARRKRWWCFFICLLIIIAIVLAVALPLVLKNTGK